MARIILVTGGCRSGKSTHAQALAEALPGRRAYVATCPVFDDELRDRIEKHRQHRRDKGWETIEEQLDLAGVLAGTADYGAADYDVLLVDCLTLWVSNVLMGAAHDGPAGSESLLDEMQIAERCGEFLAACRRREGAVIFVTNEVGMSIVPENALARRFRDLMGRCNQVVAAEADEVVLLTCGIPLTLKGTSE